MLPDPLRVKELFLAAAEKSAPERTAFLAEACADDAELRQRVERLLKAHDDAIEPVATGPGSDDGPGPTTDLEPPSDVDVVIAGRYKLIEMIGEGGMGEVWVARQDVPVKRKVAIKLIKAGMDSRAVLARFDQERQALAVMDHPNIAKVLDGGLTDERRPFFVMELVNGMPLLQYCDQATLGVRERLELFVTICHAVQHAHQKGIVHRDLKPSNILITIYDGKPVPKVIDFGVAKATGGKLTDESVSTQFGAVVGTLEYMAPEQAGLTAQDVDTRADIYALGVILYELLTGLRPFDSTRLKKAAIDEVIRILREEEPPRPSTRLSTDASSPSAAVARQTEPKRLTALLRGELDWVIMKCLEKDRNRRYETANGLAREVQRYLADEAVEARPPSARYRLRKFIQRNKGRVAAAALVLLALLGGIVGTTYGMIRADDEKRRAIAAETVAVTAAQAEKAAKFEAVIAQQKAEKARDEETKARADAVAAADAEKSAKFAALEEQQKAELAAKAEKAAKLDAVIAQQKAEKARDEEMKARAAAVAAADAEKIAKLAALAEKQKAEKARDLEAKARETTAEQRRLALDTVRDVLLRVDDLMKNDVKLAPLRIEIIRRMLDDVDKIRDHAIKNPLEERTEGIAYSRMGDIYYKSNRIKDSVEWFGRAHKVFKTLADESPKDPNALRNLAAISHQLADAEWRFGNGARARDLHAEALRLRILRRALVAGADEIEIVSADFDIAESYSFLAYAYLRLGEPKKAVENYRAADAAFGALPPPLGNTVKVRRIRSEIQVRLGDAQSRLNEVEVAEKHYRQALSERENLLRLVSRPTQHVALIKTDVGQSRMYLGDFHLFVRKNNPDAFAEYAICLRMFEELLKEDPDNLDYRQRVAAAQYRLGVTASQLSGAPLLCGTAPIAAIAHHAHTEGLRLRRELAAIDSRDTQGQIELLLSQARLGLAEEAERIVDRLLTNAGNDRQVLFQIACGLAIISENMDERGARCREQCFQILNKLIDNGWRDQAAFDQDPDLDSIRTDRRYRALLGRIKP